jgi:uncharacterized RDD family membrane protein YckC
MALAAERAISAKQISAPEKIVNFSPEILRAPFALRAAALSIDYMVVLLVPVLWLVLSRMLSELGTSAVIGPAAWLIAIILFLSNFIIFPIMRGRTLGKLLMGLTIVKINGTPVTTGAIIRRNLLGYVVTVLTLGIGFLVAAINQSGRALHDVIAGTVVVHGRKSQSFK